MNRNSVYKSDYIKKIVLCGVFAALAYVCVCVFRIKVEFLTLDIKDAIITTAAMIISPVAGLAISFVVVLIEMVTISSTAFYGFIMNFLSSATLSVVASLIYKQKKTLRCAILGLVCAVFSVTAVMMLANIFITPHFMGTTADKVIALIPKLLLPFNFTKATLNAAVVMIIYKPLSEALAKNGIIKKSKSGEGEYRFGKRTALVTVLSVLILVLSILVFFLVLDAKLSFFDIFKK